MPFHPESSPQHPAGAAASLGASSLSGESSGDLTGPGPVDVPRPIGPDRLRALREAIEAGTYPRRSDIVGGLESLFERPGS